MFEIQVTSVVVRSTCIAMFDSNTNLSLVRIMNRSFHYICGYDMANVFHYCVLYVLHSQYPIHSLPIH